MFVCVQVCMCLYLLHTCGGQYNFEELVLSYYVGSGVKTQVIEIDSKYLFLLNPSCCYIFLEFILDKKLI